MNLYFIDIYHEDKVLDFSATQKYPIYGIIHKADQGTSPDPMYKHRKEYWLSQPALIYSRPDGSTVEIPPLWGGYDFNTGQDVATQVADFIRDAEIDDHTLGCIDFEENSKSEMSAAQLVEWTQRFADATGQIPKVYSGNRIKELNSHLSDADREWLSQCDFWLAQFSAKATLTDYNHKPLPWSKYWAWQRDADNYGPDHHGVPGIQPIGVDQDYFDGTPEDLMNSWVKKGTTDGSNQIS